MLTQYLCLTVALCAARSVLANSASFSGSQELQAGFCGWPAAGLLNTRYQVGQSCPLAIDDTVGDDPGRWAPWTHRPYCADSFFSKYCVFTNSLFQSARGVSVITTPEIASTSAGLLAAVSAHGNSASHDVQQSDSHPYKVVDLPGRGKGVVAVRRIRRGEVIMTDYASVLAKSDFSREMTQAQGHELLHRAMEQLPIAEQVFSLARNRKEDTPAPEDVVRTNSFNMAISGTAWVAVFPKISRINHDCAPNAYTRFSEASLGNRIVAFHDIQPGQEITISYIEAGMTHAERQHTLHRVWGFNCSCALCQSTPGQIATSDSRRQRLRNVQAEIAEYVRRRDFKRAIELNEEVVELITKERLSPDLCEHYEVMSRLYLAATDLDNAKRFAQLALRDMQATDGDENHEGMEELRTILSWTQVT
ncbi:SET domain-containing protein [Thozetella sp. PMI_491]|nr:SET domain-containing protein [Thozetella sp. PMI_491]